MDSYREILKNLEDWDEYLRGESNLPGAGLAEPNLLRENRHILRALEILDRITRAVEATQERDEDFKTLRKGLGYCWSVVVAALPKKGMQAMELWLSNTDKDVRWIMKENLKKKRLARMDQAWVETCLAQLS